ncbi:hypothetical protein C8J57DRAFT_1466811 [Mycena rebaudengoi]|nr:hypothetical protein C8J57DRAFT_1466811 [Mycena rebaudengoi]
MWHSLSIPTRNNRCRDPNYFIQPHFCDDDHRHFNTQQNVDSLNSANSFPDPFLSWDALLFLNSSRRNPKFSYIRPSGSRTQTDGPLYIMWATRISRGALRPAPPVGEAHSARWVSSIPRHLSDTPSCTVPGISSCTTSSAYPNA